MQNAIKFTQTGEVFSRCSVIKEAIVGEDEVMLQFECHDTGPGEWKVVYMHAGVTTYHHIL